MQLLLGKALALALHCHQTGELRRAEELYRQILRADPANAQALHLFGVLIAQLGRPELGIDSIARALDLQPKNVVFLRNLALTCHNAGRLDEALSLYQRALAIDSADADLHFKLGTVHGAAGRLDDAEACYRAALRIQPDHTDACNNLGNVLREQGSLDEAIGTLQHALGLKPNDAALHNNLGNALKDRGDFAEALANFREALRLQPDFAEAHWNCGTTLLLLGDYTQGWQEYEWRRRCQALTMPVPRGPAWDGTIAAGLRVLLRAEQGLGDTLQFVRYAAVLKERGVCVFVECQRPLVLLLKGCPGIDALIAQGDALPPFDVEAPLLSVPGLLHAALETVRVPYLAADADFIEKWRAQLAPFTGFKVGVSWQGNPAFSGDCRRSIPLEHFEPVARLPQLQLFSLQKGHGAEQASRVAGRFAMVDWSRQLDRAGAFMDTAALMMSLDLVITSDTATAHLAGALGVPVWVALPFVPNWRWLLQRADSPWYPSMRLFRQQQAGGWEDVFAHMADVLQTELLLRTKD